MNMSKDSNLLDKNGRTLLVQACFNGNVAQIRSLLEAGADPNIGDKDGNYYPVIAASSDVGKSEIIELLLEYGADINVSHQNTGDSALSEAVFWENKEVAETLIKRGIDLKKHGGGALFQAVYWDKPEMLHFLLSNGVTPDAPDSNGHTALMWAALKNNLPAFLQLLEAGANPAFSAKDGDSVYSHARDGGNKKIIALVKERLATNRDAQLNLFKELDLPQEYIDYLSKEKHLKFKFSGKAEISFATLCTITDIRCINISLYPSTEHNDPNSKRRGRYILKVLDLVEDIGGDFNSMGIFVWVPDIKLFGTWDSDHYELTVFKNKKWTDILSNPEVYFNAMWQPYLNYGIVPVAEVIKPSVLWKFIEDKI